MAPKVAIVIPNWNGWQDTIECLQSIRNMDYEDYWTIIVDNGSTDDSLLRIREYCGCTSSQELGSGVGESSKRASTNLVEFGRQEALAASDDVPEIRAKHTNRLVMIRNERNLGFAEGCNIGIEFALNAIGAEYILLLNNDTIVDPAILTELVAAAENDNSIGLLSPKTYYYSHGGRKDIILFAGGKILPWREIVYKHFGGGERDVGQHDTDGETDWCSGGAMMIRSELARQRLLNAEYPFGNEDAEYSIQARKDGWRIVYVHKAIVWHKFGASRSKTGKTIRRGIYWYFRFIRANFSFGWYLYHVYLFVIVVLPKWFVMYVILHRDRHVLRGFLSEMKRFVK